MDAVGKIESVARPKVASENGLGAIAGTGDFAKQGVSTKEPRVSGRVLHARGIDPRQITHGTDSCIDVHGGTLGRRKVLVPPAES